MEHSLGVGLMPLDGADSDQALLELLLLLKERQYSFTTPTPLTHSRVLAREDRCLAQDVRGIFGWNLPIPAAIARGELLSLLRRAGLLTTENGAFRSAIRVSTLDGMLFAHSGYPTLAEDSVFFGPDTYRFVRFVKAHCEWTDRPGALRCVDVGCGSGAGGIAAALHLRGSKWMLTDINPAALRLAAVNARAAGVEVELAASDVLASTRGNFDLVICNPPYLADPRQRAYRHGGASLGRDLSLRVAVEASQRLNPGGRLLLYTGVAIIEGEDPFIAELRQVLRGRDLVWDYFEIDPDVFGEELEQPGYAEVDRIAAVGLVLRNAQPTAGARFKPVQSTYPSDCRVA